MPHVRITRRPGEGAFVGWDVRIEVVSVDADTVVLDIQAPHTDAISRDDNGVGFHSARQRQLDAQSGRLSPAGSDVPADGD